MYKIQFAKLMFYDNFNKQTWFLILLLTMLLCQKNEQNKLFDQHRLHCTYKALKNMAQFLIIKELWNYVIKYVNLH